MRLSQIAIPLAIAMALTGAGYAALTAEPEREWVPVARDAHYDIALDRLRVKSRRVSVWARRYQAYEVWFRTDHKSPRMHKSESFDREVVRAIVVCDSLWFQVLSVDMSRRSGGLVARQRNSADDLVDREWRRVERGTTEEIAATAACHFGKQAANHVAEVSGKR